MTKKLSQLESEKTTLEEQLKKQQEESEETLEKLTEASKIVEE